MGGLFLALLLQPGSVPVVPDGWVAEPYVTGLEGAMDLQWTPDGDLMVGGFGLVVVVDDPAQPWTVRAQGSFADFRFAQGSDGTLWIADTEWVTWENATLWRVPPGQTEPVVGAGYFKYCTGVLELPDGDILAVDQGLIFGPAEGRIVRLNYDSFGASVVGLPNEVNASLWNPLTLRAAPDGRVYFFDVGFYNNGADGVLYRFTPGDPAVETVLTGLNDPHDVHVLPDGTLYLLDNMPGQTNCGTLWRYNPATGDLTVQASQFPRAFGVTTGDNGWIYVADPWSGYVWVIHPEGPAPIEATVQYEPQTLNLNSRGQWFMADLSVAASAASLTEVDGAPITPIAAASITGTRAQFSRSAVQSALTAGDHAVRIEGTLVDGTPFWAEAPLRAIDP